MIEVRVPDIGDFDQVDVVEVLVEPGRRVEADESLITLESEKASMDVPAPSAGVVREVSVKVGDKVGEGDLIVTIEEAAEGEEEAAEGGKKPAKAARAAAKEAAPARPAKAAKAAKAEAKRETEPSEAEDEEEEDEAAVEEEEEEPEEQEEEEEEKEEEVEESAGEEETEEQPSEQRVARSDAERPRPRPVQRSAAAPKTSRRAPSEVGEGTQEAAPQEADATPPPQPKTPPPPPPRPAPEDASPPHASPSVRQFARELGVDLHGVEGSGPKGRILRDDVQTFVKRTLSGSRDAERGAPPEAKRAAPAGTGIPPIPAVDFSKFGPIEEKPLSRIRLRAKENLHRSWLNVPHVTQHDVADVTEMEAFRKANAEEAEKRGFKLTPLAFVMKAAVAALKEFPRVNSSLAPSGDKLVYKGYWHLGIAVDTEDGLVVPVIRDVDRKGIYELAEELAEVSARARDKKLGLGEVTGASFTITSLGGIGGTAFTPIVNAPEVAILGVSRSRMEQVWRDGQFVPRLMLPLSLSYDHRVVDGAEAVRFTTYLAAVLGDIRRLLL